MQKKQKRTLSKSPKTLWFNKSIEEVFEKTKSSADGLTHEEATKRNEKFGNNVLPKKKPKSIFKMFFEELINPIVLILLVAMALSFVAKEWLDGFVILGIVLIDAVIGTIQSKKAQRVASSLSNMIKVKTKVLRDGTKQEVDAKHLTIGDIVFLESGDKISADMRIISCKNFTVDEALLTGESINTVKTTDVLGENVALGDRTNMVFSGSTVITGRATAVVVEIGEHTEIGDIAQKLTVVEDQASPLTIRINKLSKQISLAIVVIAVIIFIVMLAQNNPFKDIFICVIALAVSAMPEGLPLAVTMALTVSSNKMGKNNVVVKNLNSVESLGSCTVIATDKTGTLTLNQQTAKLVLLPNGTECEVTGSGYNNDGEIKYKENSQEHVKQIAFLGGINNESQYKLKDGKYTFFGDSIDIAFKVLEQKAGVKNKGNKVLNSIPYESENKYSAVSFGHEDQYFITAKGSLEKILEFCTHMQMGDSKVLLNKEQLIAQNEALAKRGYRVIALAVKESLTQNLDQTSLTNMTFIGLVGFIDPVRTESKQAIAECHTAGIKVIMITGDHPLTAYSIAKEINIASSQSQVATGADVEKAFAQGKKHFDEFVKGKTVFSRVTPTDKLNIVESLKRMGEFVAVTGDGVNDSPAIKSAHIGIAMGSGTDVSKETADMIILDDNFNSIVKGIKEGRTAYSNIRKVVYFLLSGSIAEVLFFLLALICGAGTPLLAIQLLWLNVVTDGFQDLALSFEKPERGIMNEKPRATTESIFNKLMVAQSVTAGASIGLIVFGTWMGLTHFGNTDLVVARSLVMTLMVFLQNWHAFNCKSEKQSIFKLNLLENPFFLFSTIGSIGLQILFIEVDALSRLLQLTTIHYPTLILLVAISLITVAASEIMKAIIRRKERLTQAKQ